MCLIALSWDPHNAHTPLILAANRDEYYNRPSQAAHFWNSTEIYGGRDDQEQGTWMACSTSGRVAALTNVQQRQDDNTTSSEEHPKKKQRSRGHIPSLFLSSSLSAMDFCHSVLKPQGESSQADDISNVGMQQERSKEDEYNGYNVFLMDGIDLVFCSNRTPTGEVGFRCRRLTPGIYGLSNTTLDDSSWPKVDVVKTKMKEFVTTHQTNNHGTIQRHDESTTTLEQQASRIKAMMEEGIDDDVSATITRSELISQLPHRIFVKSPIYGTRTTTVVVWKKHDHDSSCFYFHETNHATPVCPDAQSSHQTLTITTSTTTATTHGEEQPQRNKGAVKEA